ncbi:speedy protein A [Pyxicephalus adspersus]|uniref:speedy protein A n=1 Tax=Pyxicephalus adspersus TaxID=30357 RepID=UPI003B5B64CD
MPSGTALSLAIRASLSAANWWRALRLFPPCSVSLLRREGRAAIFISVLCHSILHKGMTYNQSRGRASRPLQQHSLLMKRNKEEVHKGGAVKRTKGPCLIIQRQEMMAFFRIFDDDLIQDFLWMDCCCKIADKYLLAMTFVYFKRAGFSMNEYTRANFFIALYLANTVEEDDEEVKYEIFPWALGKNWPSIFPDFLKSRDELWSRIQHRATVSRRCCEEVMAIAPTQYIWQRERSEQHGGAMRKYNPVESYLPCGPSASPPDCIVCGKKGRYVAPGLSCSPSSPDVVLQLHLQTALCVERKDATWPRDCPARPPLLILHP